MATRVRADLSAVLGLGLFLALFYAPGIFGGRLLLGEDLPQFLSFRSDLYRLGHGEPFTLWNEVPGLGVPRLSNVQVGYLSPLTLPFYALPTLRVMSFHPPLLLLLLGAATYAFLRGSGLAPAPAAFGALSWIMGGTLLGHVQHPNALETMFWWPVLLLCWQRFVRTERGLWAAAAGLAGAGMMVAGHPQYLLYGLLVTGGWVAADLWRERRPRLLLGAVGIALAAVLLALPQLLPVLDFARASQRAAMEGTVLADQFRATPVEVLQSLAYERWALAGWPRMQVGGYDLAPGVSLLTLGFAVYGAVRRPALVGALVAAALFLLGMLGSGGPVSGALQAVVPFAASMRAPIRMLIPAAFLLAWAAAWGVHLWAGTDRRRTLAAAAACAWLLALWWGVHRPKAEFVDPSLLQPPQAVRTLGAGRVAMDFLSAPSLQVNAGVVAGVPQLSLYDPAISRNLFTALFASQVGSLTDQRKVTLAVTIGNMIPIVKPDLPLMRAFDLRRLVGYADGQPAARDLPAGPGRFWLAREALPAETPERLWQLAASAEWDPAAQVLTQGPVPSGGGGTVAVLEDTADRQVLQVEGEGGILVTSGLFEKGWRVTVDGAEATPLEVDVALRAVQVPAGTHRVEWTYRPGWLGAAAAGPAVALLILAGLTALRRSPAAAPADPASPAPSSPAPGSR